jgi:hypothetical protein
MDDAVVAALGEVATIDAVTVAAADGAELKSANSSSSSSGSAAAAAAGVVAVAAASLSQSSELLSVLVLFRAVVPLALLLSNALPFSVVGVDAAAAAADPFLVDCPWSLSAAVLVEECMFAELFVPELFWLLCAVPAALAKKSRSKCDAAPDARSGHTPPAIERRQRQRQQQCTTQSDNI